MTTDVDRVRHALGDLADVEVPDSLMQKTKRRVAQRRRRRLSAIAVAVALVVAASGAGIAAAVGGHNDRHHVITVEPPTTTPLAPPPPQALGVLNGQLAVVSTVNGTVLRTLPSDGRIVALSTAPGARWIAYTQTPLSSGQRCDGSPKLAKTHADGTATQLIVGATTSHPLISPNGEMVAYTYSECGEPSVVGITNLDLGSNSLLTMQSNTSAERPLAWTPDSEQLLIANAANIYRITPWSVGFPGTFVSLPPNVHAAVFESDTVLAISYPTSDGQSDVLATYDLSTKTLHPIQTFGRATVTTLSFDAASKTLLANVVGPHDDAELVTFGRRPSTTTRIEGLTSAVWYAPPK